MILLSFFILLTVLLLLPFLSIIIYISLSLPWKFYLMYVYTAVYGPVPENIHLFIGSSIFLEIFILNLVL